MTYEEKLLFRAALALQEFATRFMYLVELVKNDPDVKFGVEASGGLAERIERSFTQSAEAGMVIVNDIMESINETKGTETK